ncbi:MAG TPA: hypothetical protein DG753_13875 [Clostridium sp.]|nr:hypothetical protein [Clostridium sp.]
MNENKTTERMGSAKILPLIITMSIPAVFGNLANVMYNMVDRIFVGNYVGTDALGAIAVVLPLNNATNAISFFINTGGAALLAISFGQKKYDMADKVYSNIRIAAIFIALLIASIYSIFARPLVSLCGAVPGTDMFNYAVAYQTITSFGQSFTFLNMNQATVIRSEGNTKYASFISIIGALLNVALDTLFILVFKFGLEGAALATLISQITSVFFGSLYFLRKKSMVKFRGIKSFDIKLIIKIASMGIAPSIFQIMATVTNFLMNNSLRTYGDIELSSIGGGDLAISAFGIIMTVEQMMLSTAMGINQALQPIQGYNYGKGDYKRVKETTLTGQVVVFVICLAFWLIMMIKPEFYYYLFSSNDSNLITYGIHAMRTSKKLVVFLGYQTLVSFFFTSIGKPQIATCVSISRQIFLIPSLIILPRLFGLEGVLNSNPVSDFCSLIVVTSIYINGLHKLDKKASLQSEIEKRQYTIKAC